MNELFSSQLGVPMPMGLSALQIGLGASPFSGCFAPAQQQQPYNHFDALSLFCRQQAQQQDIYKGECLV